jgi:1-acyl-sn-glycerol-3-phosphate acyltransferase
LRLFLLGVHFLVAGAINIVIVLLRPFNPDNSRLCGRVYSVPALYASWGWTPTCKSTSSAS